MILIDLMVSVPTHWSQHACEISCAYWNMLTMSNMLNHTGARTGFVARYSEQSIHRLKEPRCWALLGGESGVRRAAW